MSVHDTLARFGGKVGAEVAALHVRWQAGELTEDQFRRLARAVLVRAGARSTALADVALAAVLTAQKRAMQVPVGLEPSEAADADAEAALSDSLGTDRYQYDPNAALVSLGGAFVAGAFQDSFQQGMRQQRVEYWRRSPNDGACELCLDLSNGIISTDVPMYHHLGCGCVQEPVQF